jgi:hypothetical protein
MRSSGLEPTRTIRSTRPSTLYKKCRYAQQRPIAHIVQILDALDTLDDMDVATMLLRICAAVAEVRQTRRRAGAARHAAAGLVPIRSYGRAQESGCRPPRANKHGFGVLARARAKRIEAHGK